MKVTGYGLEERIGFPEGTDIFLSYTSFSLALIPIQPPIQWVPGTLFPE
jgi:hypothetical protein